MCLFNDFSTCLLGLGLSGKYEWFVILLALDKSCAKQLPSGYSKRRSLRLYLYETVAPLLTVLLLNDDLMRYNIIYFVAPPRAGVRGGQPA